MKVCGRCGVAKPLEDFTRRKKGSEERRYACKECLKAFRSPKHYAKYWSWNRLSHRRTRKRQRKKNYERGRAHAVNSRDGWTLDQLRRITAQNRPCDRDLARELGRSVQAIQVMRSRARKMVL